MAPAQENMMRCIAYKSKFDILIICFATLYNQLRQTPILVLRFWVPSLSGVLVVDQVGKGGQSSWKPRPALLSELGLQHEQRSGRGLVLQEEAPASLDSGAVRRPRGPANGKAEAHPGLLGRVAMRT